MITLNFADACILRSGEKWLNRQFKWNEKNVQLEVWAAFTSTRPWVNEENGRPGWFLFVYISRVIWYLKLAIIFPRSRSFILPIFVTTWTLDRLVKKYYINKQERPSLNTHVAIFRHRIARDKQKSTWAAIFLIHVLNLNQSGPCRMSRLNRSKASNQRLKHFCAGAFMGLLVALI